MPRPRVYKLFHTFENEDSRIYFKTTMPDAHLIKLIKIWQIKLANIVQEYDWGTEEMMELLETFGCKRIIEYNGFNSCYEADMYMIWEYANTWYDEEECNKPEYNNPQAQNIFEKVIQQNREHYKDCWQQWEEKNKKVGEN